MSDKLCILVCEHFEQELKTVLSQEGFQDVTMATFPACCGHPFLNWELVAARVKEVPEQIAECLLIGGACCYDLGPAPENLPHVQIEKLEQCFYLLLNNTLVDHYLGKRNYLLSPGWLARWQEHIDTWGFTGDTVPQFFQEFAEKLLLLDSGVAKGSSEQLKEFAAVVALPAEIIPVGLEFFRLQIGQFVDKWRLARENLTIKAAADINKQFFDYVLVFDLIGELIRAASELETIRHIQELFTRLFAPNKLVYYSVKNGSLNEVETVNSLPVEEHNRLQNFIQSQAEFIWAASGQGFLVKIRHHKSIMGIVEIDQIAFPDAKEHYLNLALIISKVCGLAIYNARIFQKMKVTEEALAEEKERLYTTLDNIGLGVITTDLAGEILLINKTTQKLLHYSRRDILGKELSEVFSLIDENEPDRFGDLVKYIKEQRNLSCGLFDNIKLRSKDGIEFDLAASGVLVHDLREKVSGIVFAFADVSKFKQLERELARLDRLNLIGEMAAGLGHEIRNPMTTVRGLLQLLGEKEVFKEFQDYFELMIEEVDRVDYLITEYLFLAKNKAVFLKPNHLNTIIKTIYPLIAADALLDDKQVLLELTDIPELLLDDKEIRQLILNLIRNGLDASKPGQVVKVKTYVKKEQVTLAVQDSGPGIAPEVRTKLGTPFLTTKDQGTGLGLAICYSIAARHHAEIKVKTGSKGTTFFVQFTL